MRVIKNKAILAGLCAVLFLMVLGWADNARARGKIAVDIEPARISAGRAAVLTVTISGSRAGSPSIEADDGLRIIPSGQSSQYQSINGRVSSTVTYMYRVSSRTPGDYSIGPVTAMVDGKMESSRPLTLTVAQSTATTRTGTARATARTAPARNVASGQPSSSAGTADRLSGAEADQVAFLRLIPQKNKAYVGELLPVTIKAYFRNGLGASLDSLPALSHTAFTWDALGSEPQQTTEAIGGHYFSVLTWDTSMSAVKEGEYPVSVELDATLLLPDTSPRSPRRSRGFFDDSFFDSFFSRTREKKVTITSPKVSMGVLPLPVLGRPVDFSGAVGQFSLSALATPTRIAAGDPVTLEMVVKGTGNFDRVSAPALSNQEGWKVYTPGNRFEPSDSGGYTGKKIFEQAIIARDASLEAVPPVVFSYFDPKNGKYKSLKTRSIPLTVETVGTAGSGGRATVSSMPPRGRFDAPAPEMTEPAGLAPIHVELGDARKSFRPLLYDKKFLGGMGLALAAFLAGILLMGRAARRKKTPDAKQKKAVSRQIKNAVREMDAAICGHDVAGFYKACRTASQQRLGEIWSCPAEAITLADVRERLPEEAGCIKRVFESADAVAYSGQTFSENELKQTRKTVLKELSRMEDAR